MPKFLIATHFWEDWATRIALCVQDNSSELESLQKQAEEVIAKARAEASDEVQQAKKQTEKEIEEAAAAKKKVGTLILASCCL